MKLLPLLLLSFGLIVGCGEDQVGDTDGGKESGINLDDPLILKKIQAEAVDAEHLQERGKDGEKLIYTPNSEAPYTGWAVETNEDGNVRELRSYKNGKYNGLHVYWSKRGQKRRSGNYSNGLKDGLFTGWQENGQKSWEDNYKLGKRHGPSTRRHENGQEFYTINYKEGKKDGLATWWNEKGQRVFATNYMDDKSHGLSTRWHENGQKQMEGNAKNGEFHGNTTIWHKDGQKNLVVQWKDNKLDKVTFLYKNGQNRREINYKSCQHDEGEHEKLRKKAQIEFDAYARDVSGEPLNMVRVTEYQSMVEPWRFEQSLYSLMEDFDRRENPSQKCRYTPILNKYILGKPEALNNLDAKTNRDAVLAWVKHEDEALTPLFNREQVHVHGDMNKAKEEYFAVATYITHHDGLSFKTVRDNYLKHLASYAKDHGLEDDRTNTVYRHIKQNLNHNKMVRDQDDKLWEQTSVDSIRSYRGQNCLNGSLRHGRESFWDGEEMTSQTPWKDGMKHGLENSHGSDGDGVGSKRWTMTTNYKHNQKEGPEIGWYENGQKMFESNFLNGKREGVYTTWYQTGQKAEELNYKDDMLHGTSTWWHENGDKGYVLHWRNGKKHGLGTYWDDSGNVASNENWEDGDRIGRLPIQSEQNKEVIKTKAPAQANHNAVRFAQIEINDEKISIPIPKEMVRIDGLRKILDETVRDMLAPANNSVHALYGTSTDKALIESGEIPTWARTVSIQHNKSLPSIVSKSEFAKMKSALPHIIASKADKALSDLFSKIGDASSRAMTDLLKVKSLIKYGERKLLGIFCEGDNFVCHSILVHLDGKFANKPYSIIQATSVAVIHIQGQVVSIYASALYQKPEDLAWSRAACRQIVDTINQKSEHHKASDQRRLSSLGLVGQPALPPGLPIGSKMIRSGDKWFLAGPSVEFQEHIQRLEELNGGGWRGQHGRMYHVRKLIIGGSVEDDMKSYYNDPSPDGAVSEVERLNGKIQGVPYYVYVGTRY